MTQKPPVAVITGAARGIGAATAFELHAAGFNLVLVDVCADDPAIGYPLGTVEELEAVAEATGASIAIKADVRDQTAMADAVHTAEESLGRLDVAVACAGVIADHGPAWEISQEQWGAVLGVDLGGVQNLVSAAVPALVRHSAGHGRFIAVSSVAGTRGMAGLAAYNAAKSGVEGLIRGLAADLGGLGVTANTVSPGSTDTALLDASAAVYGLDSRQDFSDHHMTNQLIQPSEVAKTIAWLASEASSAITGATIAVDAGMSAK